MIIITILNDKQNNDMVNHQFFELFSKSVSKSDNDYQSCTFWLLKNKTSGDF